MKPFGRTIRSHPGQNLRGFPGYDNESANAFSKVFDFDDWLVEDNFQLFNRKWGPYDYYLTADGYDNKLKNLFQNLDTKRRSRLWV